MKKKLLLVLGLALSTIAQAQFFEDFEGESMPNYETGQWTLDSGDWYVWDNGIGEFKWTTFTGVTDPPMVYGERSAYINRENIGINNTDEDWLITPAVTIGPDQWLSFYNRTTISGDQGTYFQVIGIDHIADGHREFCTGRGLDRG
jgi:hypothetical protein